jgi:hypothetical protein
MDRQYIEDEDVVGRYLSGELTVREAREFEKYCLTHPKAAAQFPIPVRLKARLSRQRLQEEHQAEQPVASKTRTAADDDAEPGDGDDLFVDSAPKWRELFLPRRPLLAIVFGIAFALVVFAAITQTLRLDTLESEIVALKQSSKAFALNPPTGILTYRLTPRRGGPSASPDLSLKWPDPPQLLELRIDVNDGRYNAFAVEIDKVGIARVMQIRRIAPDSNRELRLALNSSAFGPGEYTMHLQGFTWRGELVEVGWLRIELK